MLEPVVRAAGAGFGGGGGGGGGVEVRPDACPNSKSVWASCESSDSMQLAQLVIASPPTGSKAEQTHEVVEQDWACIKAVRTDEH